MTSSIRSRKRRCWEVLRTKQSGRPGPYRQASPPARHRPGARSARRHDVPQLYRRPTWKGRTTMSFPSWLQNLRSALAPRRRQRHHRLPGSAPAATLRPNLEALENRLTPSLVWAGEFPVPYYPQALVSGDVNNDGHLDLATANNDGTVSVLLGDGLGGFGVALQSAVGAGPSYGASMAVADLNNDGNLDV